jgi:hypothetical protein
VKLLCSAVLLVVLSSGPALALNDDLRQVTFSFDKIPCGQGTKTYANLTPHTSESKFLNVPAVVHGYYKNNKLPSEPLDWSTDLWYYREKVGSSNVFTLIGYVRRINLGKTQDEITVNYNKVYADLKQLLGSELLFVSETSGTPDINKTSTWAFTTSNNRSQLINLFANDDKTSVFVQTTCADEYYQALDKEKRIQASKQSSNMFE